MKTTHFIIILLTSLSTITFSQEKTSRAQFISRSEIRLDSNSDLKEYYIADISGLNFSNAEEAVEYFNSKTDNLLSYEIDFNKKEVIVHLHIKSALPFWKLSDWQNYLNNKYN